MGAAEAHRTSFSVNRSKWNCTVHSTNNLPKLNETTHLVFLKEKKMLPIKG